MQLLSFAPAAGAARRKGGGGMKLIVQIPCLNEAETLPATLATIPTSIPGIDTIEILVIDDGSTDGTVEVARQHGVHHVVRHVGNKGLAEAFQSGLDACLRLGADVIVNTDGDNQYPQQDIPRLVAPILDHRADIVIGDRQTKTIEHFSLSKKALQQVGSWVVRKGSGTRVPDAPSGFRAYSREAALRLNVVTRHSYTLETIIQAGKKNLVITAIPVTTNRVTRPSRLMRGTYDYIKKQGATIVRIYAMYEPLKVFFLAGGALVLIGALLLLRYLFFKAIGTATGPRYLQSVIIGSVMLTIGVLIVLIGLVADLIASVRRLLEDTLYRVKKLELMLERERGEREQLLASILNFNEAGGGESPTPAEPVDAAGWLEYDTRRAKFD
ncbi:MAG TPA: glycosyltransferase family 2 protein [Thermomicrobiales bacterium]|nr:glycosyltransferase family 2 protein [Thermomicrobiales bacterium]